jgi:hypothetical protein
MYLKKLIFACCLLFNVTSVFPYDFYTIVVGGKTNRQAKYFTREGSSNLDGWQKYSAFVIDRDGFYLSPRSYEVNCKLESVIVSQEHDAPLDSSELQKNMYRKQLTGAELNDILHPACNVKSNTSS